MRENNHQGTLMLFVLFIFSLYILRCGATKFNQGRKRFFFRNIKSARVSTRIIQCHALILCFERRDGVGIASPGRRSGFRSVLSPLKSYLRPRHMRFVPPLWIEVHVLYPYGKTTHSGMKSTGKPLYQNEKRGE